MTTFTVSTDNHQSCGEPTTKTVHADYLTKMFEYIAIQNAYNSLVELWAIDGMKDQPKEYITQLEERKRNMFKLLQTYGIFNSNRDYHTVWTIT